MLPPRELKLKLPRLRLLTRSRNAKPGKPGRVHAKFVRGEDAHAQLVHASACR